MEHYVAAAVISQMNPYAIMNPHTCIMWMANERNNMHLM